ncbi:MAG: phosphoribosylanthranilate isomerase [Acidiferrobacterales bacterium]|nr:phosphoribosylanthranilate isomerase [Acidiferrobacterales bacterium]
MRTRVKICGITRAEDAQTAARLGADAIGMVFYDASPRNISIEQAQALARSLPPFVCRVGLFVDADPQFVKEVMESVPLDMLQFHGNESATDCDQFHKPYIKAIRMESGLSVSERMNEFSGASAMLLDTYSTSVAGGSGESFDWSLVPQERPMPIILAGGLHAGNVAEAIRVAHPYAVDVSSGVERDKGIKDADKMSAFINEVNRQL